MKGYAQPDHRSGAGSNLDCNRGLVSPGRLSHCISPNILAEPSLYTLRFPRFLQSFPVCTNDAEFFPVESGELYRHSEERVLVLLVVRSE